VNKYIIDSREEHTNFECPVNLTKLMKLIDGDEELLNELIDILIHNYPEHIKKVKGAIEESDFKNLQKIAHNLKGSVSNFGAERAYKLAYELENMGRECCLDNVYDILYELETEMKKIEKFLTNYKL
jgi:HPt (histidine-containing phosphotransfer) domain-containing protein